MSDITMCSGLGCPIRNECRRFTAIPDPQWQSYFVLVPYDFAHNMCDNFLPQLKWKDCVDSTTASTKRRGDK